MIGQHFQDAFLMIIDDVFPWMCAGFQLIYIYLFWILRVLLYVYIYSKYRCFDSCHFPSTPKCLDKNCSLLFWSFLIYIFWSCSHDEPSGGPWQRFHFGQLQQHVVPLQLSWIKERFWVEWNCWVDEFSWHFIGFHAILWWMFNGFYMVLWWTCEIHELLTWVYVWIYGGLMDWLCGECGFPCVLVRNIWHYLTSNRGDFFGFYQLGWD